MTNTINQIPSAYGLTAANNQTATASSSTSDTLSSFKDILSTMMTVSSGLSGGQQADSGLSNLMSPLLMIILLEKLVEDQMEGDISANSLLGSSVSGNTSKAEPSGRPVGGVLTQDYHPGHNGLDFGVVVGTPVQATMDGNVIYAGWNDQGYGNLVIVENGEYRTYYAHLSSIPVSVGESVSAGSTIGLSGNTGNSTGPHLHYEIRRNKIPIDPTSVTLS